LSNGVTVDQVIGTEEQGKKGERLHGTENKDISPA
jgi:hypothetical protein